MQDQNRIKKNLKHLQVIKTWQLLVLLILMVFLSATFLRLNNVGMVQRRNAVLDSDKTGNTQELTSRIYDLQRYSAAHMNADSGVFYLQQTYNRDVQALVSANSAQSTSNQSVNDAAEAVCHPQFSSWSPAYVQCFVNELNKHTGPNSLPTVQLPSPALYRYSFVAPLWSPDFAGWSVLLTGLIMIAIILRIVTLFVLRLLLKRHYRHS